MNKQFIFFRYFQTHITSLMLDEYIILIKLPVLAHKNENLVVYFDTEASYLKVGLIAIGIIGND